MSSSAYDAAVSYLYGLSYRGIDLGLERVRRALSLRGDPQRSLRFVHVAGTNGKGSVSALVESMLRAAGHRTGLYTSPHLHRFVERVRVDGEPVADDVLVRAVEALRSTPDMPALSFFEAATVVALECFRDLGCEIVVLEVGLGGRLDATNVVVPEICVVTNVGLDHMGWLGDTLEAIAAEKAAIAKPGRVLVSGVQGEGASAVVRDVVRGAGATLVELDRDATFELSREDGLALRCGEARIRGVPWQLAGAHQGRNLALAVLTALELRRHGVELPDPAIVHGAATVRWPGRLELLEGAPAVLLDGAHNPDGCRALAEELARSHPERPRVLVFGAMADKQLGPMLHAFDGLVDERVYVAPELDRATPPTGLSAIVPGHVGGSVRDGLALAERLAGPDGLVVVAGSLFVVAAARAIKLGLRVDPPIAM